MVESILRDVRFAARGLVRSPGFTTVAVLALALGIGATTAVFSVVYGVIFRPLPFPNGDRLVQIVQLTQVQDSTEPYRSGLRPEQIDALRTSARSVSGVSFAIPALAGAAMTDTATPARLAGVQVGAPLFDMLGVRPMVGRRPGPADCVRQRDQLAARTGHAAES